MKEKFWKELKSQLCPRQNWMNDQQIGKCQCCGKDFTFFRRRHHCRFCGKIFCSDCSDLYINGNYLGLNQKFVRHCEFCKEQIQKIKRDLNRLTYMVQDEEEIIKQQSDDDSASSSDEDNDNFTVKNVYGSTLKEKEELNHLADELDGQIRLMNKRLLKRLVELGGINSQFLNSELLNTINRAVIQTKMNILPHDLNSPASCNYMDINKQLFIKTIYGQPGEILDYVDGIVIDKTFPIKGMISKLTKPQILIIQNSLDEGSVSNKLKFEEMIASQHVIVQQLQERVMKLNPDIIFVERAVSRQMLSYFLKNGVCVMNGLKKKDMQKIIKISGIRKTIKNIWNVSKIHPNKFLGNVDSMEIMKYEHQSSPFLFLKKNIGVYTIIVSQKSSESQNTLKKSLQILIKLLRQMHLEKYLIYVDFEMWQDRQNYDIPRLYKLNSNYIPILQKMNTQQIQFYRIHLSELNVAGVEKKVQEYCKQKNRQYLLEMCGHGRWENRSAYSDEDQTIGHFLLIMATGFVKKCSICQNPHRQRYYFSDKGLELSVRKIRREFNEGEEEDIHGQQDLTVENMHKYLKKYKQNSNIFSYFMCKNCHEILSKKAKIGKNYLKNSYYYFLQLVTNSDSPLLQQRKSLRLSYQTNSQAPAKYQCPHLIVERVLQTSDIRFRMQMFQIQKYDLNIINLMSEDAGIIKQANIKKYICELMIKQIVMSQQYVDLLLIVVGSYIGNLQVYRMYMSPADSKMIIQLQKLESLRQILEKLKEFLNQLDNRQKNKQVTFATDWTYFLRQIAKSDYVFKCSIELLLQIEGKLHKKKKKMQDNDVQIISVYEHDIAEVSIVQPTQQNISFQQQSSDYLKTQFLQKQESNVKELKREKSKQAVLKKENSRQNLLEIQGLTFQRLNSKDKSNDETEKKQDKLSNRTLSNKRFSTNNFSFSQIYDQTKFKVFLEDMKKKRYPLKKGQFLYFSLVNYKNPISVLVCALNSIEFSDQLQKQQKKSLQKFKLNLVLTKDIPTSWQLKHCIDKIKIQNPDDQNQSRQSYQIISYYHKEFEQLRIIEGVTFDSYVKSLAGSQIWDSTGGKSKAQFAKSHDSILVVKIIKEEEFVQFQKFACDYLKHIKNAKNKQRNSFLAKIYGIYEMTIRGSSYKCVVMQNIFFGLQGLPLTVYDLKGSQLNRLQIPSKGSTKFTGLDTNFKIDKNYHPYFLKQDVYSTFYQMIEDDVNFLSKNEVIDYSLLVVESDRSLRMGIIDFMRPYHFKQKVEKKFKQFKYGLQPTVMPPPEYANRFLQAMKRYFSGDKWIVIDK